MTQPHESETRLYTVAEAAARLRISLRTMRGLIATGQLPIVRVTKARVVITENDLAAYVAARREVAS